MTEESNDLKLQEECVQAFTKVKESLHSVIVGMDEPMDVLFWTLLARGHGLFVGVPGLAKTLLVSTMSQLLGLKFNRIQFTPDMMPSDLIGSEILEEDHATGKRVFEFRKGPLFCQLLLADEINRTPPKTQSALLQVMQEGKVSFAGDTHTLTPPFIVFATQNPIESEGTYPLPEAQLDRFLFSIPISYPTETDEIEIVKKTTTVEPEMLLPLLDAEKLIEFQHLVRKLPIEDHLVQTAVQIVRRSRPDEMMKPELAEMIRFGAGPRASQAIALGAKARALLSGRFAVREEDLYAVAPYVLQHRLVLRRLRDRKPEQIVSQVISAGA